MISDHGPCGEMSHAIMPNPLDPTVCLAGVIPSKCTVFKSALLPLRLTYKTISRGVMSLCLKEKKIKLDLFPTRHGHS